MKAKELVELLANDDTEESPKQSDSFVAKILALPEAKGAQTKAAKAREEKADFKMRLKLAQDQLANAHGPDPDGPKFGTPDYQAWKAATFGRAVDDKPDPPKPAVPRGSDQKETPAVV